jgi:hypothetical protein
LIRMRDGELVEDVRQSGEPAAAGLARVG